MKTHVGNLTEERTFNIAVRATFVLTGLSTIIEITVSMWVIVI